MTAEELYRAGRERWPSFELDEQTFTRLLAAQGDDGDLDRRRADDLFLAFACAVGDERAIAELDRSLMPTAVAAVRRMRGSAAAADDVAQGVRSHVLVADGDEPPRIATYAGTGSLKSWLSAIAVRRYLRSLRGNRREVLIGDGALMDAVGTSAANPELAVLKETYREQFRAGFSEALDQLEAKKKTLLRMRFVDGLTVTELAKIFDVHRATLHRWLGDAQEEVADVTEQLLCSRLSVTVTELASIRRLVHSQLEVSIERLLGDEDPV